MTKHCTCCNKDTPHHLDLHPKKPVLVYVCTQCGTTNDQVEMNLYPKEAASLLLLRTDLTKP